MGGGVTAEVNDLALAQSLDPGHAARDAGDFAAAERCYAEAVAQFPDSPEARHHLGGAYRMQGRLDLAEAEYRRALQLAPGAAATARVLAVMLLSQGRYPEGFALLEARHEMPTMAKPPLPFPEWRGEPVAGKRLLIWPEQGFGDQIQFARFAPVLKAMGAEVTLLCHPELVRLFEGSLGVQVLAAKGAVEFPDPDYFVMQGSLAARLGVRVDTIPNAPYLRAPHPSPRGAAVTVGLKLAGNPHHTNDANRSLTAEAAAAIRALPVDTLSLEPADTGAADFAETADILAGLDLVISVDTSVAHLAGAMGKPCWVLLPQRETDWRWLRERVDSPWYPSMRLYRQAVAGDWSGPIAAIRRDLAALRR